MNIAKFAGGIRTVVMATAMAMIASFGASQAYAADAAFKIDPVKQAKGMADAPAIIATAKITCDPSNAYALGQTDYEKPDKTKVKGTLYEIACKTGPGFIITAVSATEVYQPFTCMMAAKVQKAKPESILCVLPENKPAYKWLTPIAQPYLPGCEISDVRMVGSTSTAPLIDRYEVGCGAKVGGVIDYPQLGSTAAVEFKPCILMQGSNSECTLSTAAQIAESIKPLAAKADPKCQVNNARFVGVSKENSSYFYEFGCSNEPGFMVQATAEGAFTRIVPCASAAGLGGCTFTDKGAAMADANAGYSALLKAAGYPCTVSDYDVQGTQESTHRDYMEFKCPEQPWGLIGFVPQPGSTGSTSVTDCAIVKSRQRQCTLTTDAALKGFLDKLIKISQPTKNCDVADVRYIGESAGVAHGLLAELACVNKRGYIVLVAADRQSLMSATPCKIAKAHKEEQQCQIAGNGTYNPANPNDD